MSQQIALSADFFRNEARNYARPAQSFWRELVQNSVDAGATRISVNIDQLDSQHTLVEFSDNGRGMDRATLENVFFSLGSTSKSGPGQVGGFGKARVLLCFAQQYYEITTQNVVASGEHAAYTITNQKEYQRGTTFRVSVDLEVLRTTHDLFVRELNTYLAFCQLNVEVQVNGNRFTNWMHRRQVARQLSFGHVHVNRSGGLGIMVVRVAGAAMFMRGLYSTDATVIVEIDPERSREVLLSNRDSLNSTAQEELDRFVQEIAANSKSALKSDTIVTEVSRGLARPMPRSVKPEPVINTLPPESQSMNAPIEPVSAEQQELSEQIHQAARNHGAVQSDSSTVTLPDAIDPITEGMIIRVRGGNPDLKRIARKFRPDQMNAEGQGRDRRKLLVQWDMACQAALMALSELGVNPEGGYRVGWTFDHDVNAEYVELNDDSHALLLNPVNDQGKIQFGVRSWDAHMSLITLACHEVAHIVNDMHDEQFASCMTDLIRRVMCHAMDLHTRMSKWIA